MTDNYEALASENQRLRHQLRGMTMVAVASLLMVFAALLPFTILFNEVLDRYTGREVVISPPAPPAQRQPGDK
jgi:hypothetical protein